MMSANVTMYRAKMECAICTHSWWAYFQAMTRKLECPNCGYWNTAPDTPPENNATPA